MTNPFSVTPSVVEVSSTTEAGLSEEIAATTAAGAAALIGVRPMAADLDSALFANALNAAGGAYLAAVAEQVVQRSAFGRAQHLASGTYAATEAIRAAAVAL